MAGKFLEQMEVLLGGGLQDSDILYVRRPTDTQLVRDKYITWAELKNGLGIAAGSVISVFGRDGAVVAVAGDYSASEVTNDSGVSGTNVDDALNALYTAISAKPVVTQTEALFGYISAPGNGDHQIALKSPVGFTIEEVTTKADSGTITATWKIDGVALGGAPNTVSTSEDTQVHSSTNVVAVGQDISLTTSADSSCTGFAFTMKLTRTLAN